MKPPIRRVGDNVIVCKAQLSAQQGRRQSFAQSVIAAATLNEDGDYVLPHDKMLALMRVKVTTNPKPKRAQDATIAAREAICKGCSFWEPAGFGKCTKCITCSGRGLLVRAFSKCPLPSPKWGPELTGAEGV
ncbi:hypothetical protein SAMN05444156_3216 [Verrucomicrobium sp. GAS474]|nr:hypothetical protein SAMN05444156_3216 [Verrucomicrobium sp. GAS474]